MDHEAITAAMELLTSADAGAVLRAALAPTGAALEDWQVRNVHRRGRSSVSVVYDVTARGGGASSGLQVVAHSSTRTVPEGATVLDVGGLTVHVWRVPNDPYLPGMPSAVDAARVRDFLDRVGGPEGEVTVRTRAYRPTRRAVVEVTLTEQGARLMYLKILGGSTPDRVRRRATELADTHRALASSLPVPKVVGVSASQGIVALTALSGRTLRNLVVNDRPLPDPSVLVQLSRSLLGIEVTTGNDPRRYANIDRHVRHLRRLLPDQADVLDEIHSAVSDIGGPVGTVHGDLHDGQLLFDDGPRLSGVLDVDGVGVGHVASDAGRLVAYIQAAGFVAAIGDRADRYASEVAAAYEDLIDPDQLARGAAAAWVGLATGPYRSQKPSWQELTRRRLARASAWAARLG